jgi:hypothetical protein
VKHPPNKSGDHASAIAASHEPSTAKLKGLVSGESVNLAQVGRWIDEAILINRNAASDPCEHQRLGIWLARIRRALP